MGRQDRTGERQRWELARERGEGEPEPRAPRADGVWLLKERRQILYVLEEREITFKKIAGSARSFQELYFTPAAGVSSRSASPSIDFSDTLN